MSIPLFLPLYVLPVLITQPEGTLALVFTYLPVTSVMTVGFLSIFREVPTHQIALSAGISALSGLGIVWLAARAFRIGMLRYGKGIRLREVFGRGGIG
jgi:ABC-2 type transport system permease protein